MSFLQTTTIGCLTLYQVLMFFFLYGFLGWCTEVAYAALELGKLVNRGFLNGPICPIYGVGMVFILLLLEPIKQNGILLFLGSILITTGIELVGGWVLYRIFHARWWDYSEERFNLGGYICLKFSLLWGLGTLIVIDFVHPIVDKLASLPPLWLKVTLLAVFLLAFLTDLTVTVFTMIGLNKKLRRLDRISSELHTYSDALTKRIGGTVISATELSKETGLAELTPGDLMDADKVKPVVAALTQAAKEKALDVTGLDEWQQKLAAGQEEYRKLRESIETHSFFGEGRLLRAFPDMVHEQYQEALENLEKSMAKHTKRFRGISRKRRNGNSLWYNRDVSDKNNVA